MACMVMVMMSQKNDVDDIVEHMKCALLLSDPGRGIPGLGEWDS